MAKATIYEVDGAKALQIGLEVSKLHLMVVAGYLSRQCPFRSSYTLKGTLNIKSIIPRFPQNFPFSFDMEEFKDHAATGMFNLWEEIDRREAPGIKGKNYPNKGILFSRRTYNQSSLIPVMSDALKGLLKLLSVVRTDIAKFGKEIEACYECGIFLGVMKELKKSDLRWWELNKTGNCNLKPSASCGNYFLFILKLLGRDQNTENISPGGPVLLVKPTDNVLDMVYDELEADQIWSFPGEKDFLKNPKIYGKLKFKKTFTAIFKKNLYKKGKSIPAPLIDFKLLFKKAKKSVSKISPEFNHVLKVSLCKNKKSKVTYKEASTPEQIKFTLGPAEAGVFVKFLLELDGLKIFIPTGLRPTIQDFPNEIKTQHLAKALSSIGDKLETKGIQIHFSKDKKGHRKIKQGLTDWLLRLGPSVFLTIE